MDVIFLKELIKQEGSGGGGGGGGGGGVLIGKGVSDKNLGN